MFYNVNENDSGIFLVLMKKTITKIKKTTEIPAKLKKCIHFNHKFQLVLVFFLLCYTTIYGIYF